MNESDDSPVTELSEVLEQALDKGDSAVADAGVSRAHDVESDFTEAGLRRALEAILIVVDEPVGDVELAQVLECPREAVNAALVALAAEYLEAGRGFVLRHVAGGWRFYSDPDSSAYVERFVLDGQSGRLSQAALETLAVVAYLQPVTRARIGAIRGVNVEGVMRTLQARGLIEDAGHEGAGGATLFRTSRLFLEKMGLDSLAHLPSLAPLLPDVATFLQEEESLSP